MISIKDILQDMLTHRTRLTLIIIAVAWGTFSITSMLAFGEGLRLSFKNMMDDSGKGALVVTGKQTTKAHHGLSNGIKISLTQLDLEKLKSMLIHRADITGAIEWDIPITYHGKISRGPPINAVEPLYKKMHAIKIQKGGRFINERDDLAHAEVIVLGDQTVKKLFNPNEDPLGEYVFLKDKPFLVIGVQKKSMQLISTNQYPDDYTNWIPYSTYQELSHQYQYSNFIIAPFDLSMTSALQDEIRNYIAVSRQMDPDDPGILEFVNIKEEKEKINTFFYGLEMIMGLIGSLTLIVAGVGIANVMMMSVASATREIGVRMALGAKTEDILIYYIIEALITTAIGGFVGLIATKLLMMGINHIPIHSDILQAWGNPKPIVSWEVLMIVVIVLSIIGLLAGYFPARRAALIHPAEALRYE